MPRHEAPCCAALPPCVFACQREDVIATLCLVITLSVSFILLSFFSSREMDTSVNNNNTCQVA
jgi:hypothetical protein